MSDNMLDQRRFSLMVEEKVRDAKMGYIDSILHICNELNMEGDEATPFISSIIKDKVEAEAVNLRYFKGGNTLPL